MATTAEIGKLRAELVLKNKKFESGMKRAQKSAKKTAGAFKGMGGALAAAFGVAAIGRFVQGTLSMADSVGKFADRIGISTDALQEYRLAFDIAGVEQKKLDKGLLEFGKRIAQARVETGSMVTILGRLDAGLLETLKSTKNTNQAFEIMFKALGDATDQATKLALADAAFGGPGLKMTSAFKDGTKAFRETIAEGRRLNLFLEEELVRGAENVNDRFNIASRAIGVNFKRAFLRLAPALSATARFLSENMPAAIQVTSNAFETLISGMAFANLQINKSLNIMLIGIADTLEKLQRIFVNTFDIDPRKLGFITGMLKELRAQIKDNIPIIQSHVEHLKNLFLIQGKTGLGKFPPGSGLEPEFDLTVGGGKAPLLPGTPTLDLAPQFGDAPRTEAFLRMKEILQNIKEPFKAFNDDLALANKLMLEGKISKSQFLDFRIELSQEHGLSNLKTLLQEMNDPLKNFRQHFQELKFLQEEGKITQDQFTESLRNLNLNAALFLSEKNAILGLIRDITVNSVDRFAQMFDAMFERTLDFKEAFIGILKEIRLAIIRTFTQRISENILSFAADFLLPGAGSAVRVASRAHGGPVGAGGAFLVGERGPELFTPGVSGRITPNDKITGNTIYIDARNSNGEEELLRKMRKTIAEAAPFLTNVAVQTVRDIHSHDPDFLR
ncbi:MAG TPA: hypothetical protein ENH91_10135 [Leeuwenhoekiella sp.]|nr:hypothetical protein [Leeuwenhoekiella sp.]